MIKLLVTGFLFCIILHSTFAQSVENLDKKNGFQDILLMSDVKSYKHLIFDENIAHEKVIEAQRYLPEKGYYENIGTVKIKSLEVVAYKDNIFEIHILTEQDPDLYKGLKKVFGKPEYSVREDLYYWSGKNVRLTFTSHSKKRLSLSYYSYQIDSLLKEEKAEEIESIADDF